MRKTSLHKLFLLLSASVVFLSSCRDDSALLVPPVAPDQSFIEEFDTASAAFARGWKPINNSYPIGPNVWQNGGDVVSPIFSAFSQRGSYVGFIGATVNSSSTPPAIPNRIRVGITSNWLLSPEKIMVNGDKIIFYARSQVLPFGTDETDWGNRMQVRINTRGEDFMNVGTVFPLWETYTWAPPPGGPPAPENYDDPGSYDRSLLEVNPNGYEWHKIVPGTSVVDGRAYDANTNLQAFPTRWTRFEATVDGLDGPTKTRFAFRYFVPGGDPNNGFATAIGIDRVEYKSVR
jgi:hypothetical protein